MTLTLNFQGQIWNLLYLNQKWPIATKQKANISIELKASNVTIRFVFQVKYLICYISAQNGPIATKRKANISIEL